MKYLSGSSAVCRMHALRFVVLLSACLVSLADASARDVLTATPDRSSIRAAQLFARDGRWEGVSPRSAREERAEIRAHFAVVRDTLLQDTPSSLDIAVARLEAAGRFSLTPESRAELRSSLLARRAIQLERLREYARAGSFPLNRHYAGEARPIFVDARGTHCAVGHLMALDGWEAEVEAIARAKPNVLVREVADGPLVSWVLTSGVTQEEAALIQPGYYPPTSDATKLSDLVVPGTSLDRNGVRYENFAFSATSTGGASAPTAAQLALVYGWPPVGGTGFCLGSPGCGPRPDGLWFGVLDSSASFNYLFAVAGQSISIDIAYDVVALASGLAIGGTETSASQLYGGFLWAGGTGSLSTTLDTLVLDFPPGVPAGRVSALFAAPATRAHARHRVQIADGAAFGSFDSVILRATAAPLPGSAGLLVFSLALLGRYVRSFRISPATSASRPSA